MTCGHKQGQELKVPIALSPPPRMRKPISRPTLLSYEPGAVRTKAQLLASLASSPQDNFSPKSCKFRLPRSPGSLGERAAAFQRQKRGHSSLSGLLEGRAAASPSKASKEGTPTPGLSESF